MFAKLCVLAGAYALVAFVFYAHVWDGIDDGRFQEPEARWWVPAAAALWPIPVVIGLLVTVRDAFKARWFR